MISKIKSNLGFYKNSRKDWSTKEKLLIIESDDWGTIRMPSKESYDEILKQGIPVDKCAFSKYDNLETSEDLDAIESIFENIHSNTGKKPVITANYILANPDFGKIAEMGFNEYHREYFWNHLEKNDKLQSYKASLHGLIDSNFFHPQLHGLEHVNVPYWMKFLKNNSKETMIAFENGVFGISAHLSKEKRDTHLAEFDYQDDEEFNQYVLPSIKTSADAFEDFFGYRSKSFIAPNYVWSERIEKALSENGVEYIQSSRSQMLPKMYSTRAVNRNTGLSNNYGQIYLVRNCIFEPSTTTDKRNHLDQCIRQIRNAFLLNKPAIISSHRLNYMGGIVPLNREENLRLLNELLQKVIKRWPDVQFINSTELGNKIKG